MQVTTEIVSKMYELAEDGRIPALSLERFSALVHEDPKTYVDAYEYVSAVQKELDNVHPPNGSRLVLGYRYNNYVHWHLLHQGERGYGTLTPLHCCDKKGKF